MVENDFGYQGTHQQQQQQQQQQLELADKKDAEILEWIGSMPLSRPVKNLARDFSDAVLMSEIVKLHWPHMVCLRHYVPANSVQGKKENWISLNRRVLSKLDARLSAETIEQLARSRPGLLGPVLHGLRARHELDSSRRAAPAAPAAADPPPQPSPPATDRCEELRELEEPARGPEPQDRPEDGGSVFALVHRAASAVLALFARALVAPASYFWRCLPIGGHTSAKAPAGSAAIEARDEHQGEQVQQEEQEEEEGGGFFLSPSLVRSSEGGGHCTRALDELRAKSEMVEELGNKVTLLEGAIASLASELARAVAAERGAGPPGQPHANQARPQLV